ncbi:MAG TPA: hypothetical protein VE690_13185 [Rhodopila sp.]|nr:hypothetical protein [Rhodopila sp.]
MPVVPELVLLVPVSALTVVLAEPVVAPDAAVLLADALPPVRSDRNVLRSAANCEPTSPAPPDWPVRSGGGPSGRPIGADAAPLLPDSPAEVASPPATNCIRLKNVPLDSVDDVPPAAVPDVLLSLLPAPLDVTEAGGG